MRRGARPALLLLALAPVVARAEFCIDYAPWHVRQFGRPNYCWPSPAACQDYYRSRCLNPTYAKDCAGGCYERGGAKATAAPRPAGPSPAAAAAMQAARQQQLQQQQKQREELAAARAFQQELKGLEGQLKGPPPSTSGQRQLQALAGSGAEAAAGIEAPGAARQEEQARLQAGWPAPGPAAPFALKPPPPPRPPVDAGAVAPGPVPRWLLEAMAGARRDLATQDREVVALEREVALAEQAAARSPPTVAVKGPAPREDEALRAAREALARARANREKTRADLERMEREGASGPPSQDGVGPDRP